MSLLHTCFDLVLIPVRNTNLAMLRLMATDYRLIRTRNSSLLLEASHFLHSPARHALSTFVSQAYLVVSYRTPQHLMPTLLTLFLGCNYLALQPKRVHHVNIVLRLYHLLVQHVLPIFIPPTESFTMLPFESSERTWTRYFSAWVFRTVSIACVINCTGTPSWKGGPVA